MNQHISEERLTAFVDNQVEEPETGEIGSHLKTCSQCAAFVREMRILFDDLERLSPADEVTGLKEDTLHLLRISRQQPRPAGIRIGPSLIRNGQRLIAAGAIAAGLAVGIMFGSIAYQGLFPDNRTGSFPTVVLQDNDQTINDTYVAMIINEGEDY